MTNAGRFVKTKVKDVAGIFLVDEHVAAVVDAEGAEDDAELLDTFGRAQLTGTRFEAWMEWEMRLPHLATLECARLQFERCFQVGRLLLVAEKVQMVATDSVGSWLDVRRFVLMPNVIIGLRFQQLIAQPRIVQILP